MDIRFVDNPLSMDKCLESQTEPGKHKPTRAGRPLLALLNMDAWLAARANVDRCLDKNLRKAS